VTRQRRDKGTNDDILDSLTRQAKLRQKLGGNDRAKLEEIAETEDVNRYQGFNSEPGSALRMPEKEAPHILHSSLSS